MVKYLVVGGYAVGFYAQPRATKDLDLLIKPDLENGQSVYAPLFPFGAPLEGFSSSDFIERDSFFRMGHLPLMVEILAEIKGVDFDEAWQRRVEVEPKGKLKVPFISRADLMAAKLAAGPAGSR